MSSLAVAAAAAVEVEAADVAGAGADVEVVAEVRVPVAAFLLPADPHARHVRAVDRARVVGRVRAIGQARALGRAKAAAKRLRDRREVVARPVANRPPRDLREVVHPLRRVQHAPRAAQRVKALWLDSVQGPAAGRRIALPAAVRPLASLIISSTFLVPRPAQLAPRVPDERAAPQARDELAAQQAPGEEATPQPISCKAGAHWRLELSAVPP
jgi:hypothetical protein